MKAHTMLGIVLAIFGGLIFFWLVPLKLISRLAARFGASAPCPASLSWLVDNPFRRRYMGPILDRVGICPGECVLELGPGPGAFTVDAARRAGSEGRLIAVGTVDEIKAKAGKETLEEAFIALTGLSMDNELLAWREQNAQG